MSEQVEGAGLAGWIGQLVDAVGALKPAAGQFARDPSDAAAAGAALEQLEAVRTALGTFSYEADAARLLGGAEAREPWPWLAESRSALDEAAAGIAQLAASQPVDDPRALAKPLSVWLRGADKELKALTRALAEESEREAASRAEAEILAARRSKLDRLREQGVEPFPYAFEGAVAISGVRAAHADLEPARRPTCATASRAAWRAAAIRAA